MAMRSTTRKNRASGFGLTAERGREDLRDESRADRFSDAAESADDL
jgi:hypothetical protein